MFISNAFELQQALCISSVKMNLAVSLQWRLQQQMVYIQSETMLASDYEFSSGLANGVVSNGCRKRRSYCLAQPAQHAVISRWVLCACCKPPVDVAGMSKINLPLGATGVKVVVQPVVLFSICDSFIRRGDGQNRVIGTLLGTVEAGVVDLRLSYAVPHIETPESVRGAMPLQRLKSAHMLQQTFSMLG